MKYTAQNMALPLGSTETLELPNEPLTPVERHGALWFKRDDLFTVAGVSGGKVRTCWHLAQGAIGLITAGSRSSPQVNIVAHIAKALGIPCRCHVPTGKLLPEVEAAANAGAEIIQHKPGYNSVIVARARTDAIAQGWFEIPFGMKCDEAPRQTASQVRNLPNDIKRIVVPVGSGMSLAGVLRGLQATGLSIPVLGVVVGANPIKRLNQYAPLGWQNMCQLVESGVPYDKEVKPDFPVTLDSIYEAKCVKFLQADDLFWIVGIRQTADPAYNPGG